MSLKMLKPLIRNPWILSVIGVYIIYSPLNYVYLVKVYGCGCRQGFNANHITFALTQCTFLLSLLGAFCSSGKMGFPERKKYLLKVAATNFVIAFIGLNANLWL